MPRDDQTPRRHALALVKIQRSAQLVEQAQHTLEAAAAELSPVTGGAALWRALCLEADRCHRLWARLDRAPPGRFGLDHEPP